MRLLRHSLLQPPIAIALALLILWVLLLFITAMVSVSRITKAQTGTPIISPIRISQLYGGGGNQDATLHSDFVELFNAGPDAVNLNGWSVQYAAKEGDNWGVTVLGDVTIEGFGYLLIRQAAGDGGSDVGSALETPDISGDTSMSASEGKIALVAGTAAILGLTDSAVVDFVGYGNANEAEGAPTDKLANPTAAFRLTGGCTDTNHNGADFERLPPMPRNRMAPLNPCPLPSTESLDEAPATTMPTPPLITDALTVTVSAPLSPTLVVTDMVTPDLRLAPLPVVITETLDTPTSEPTPALVTEPVTDSFTLPATVTLTPIHQSGLDEATPTTLAPAMPLPTPSETPLATPSFATAPLATPPPHLLITEFLADPKAVKDEDGEWLEIFNADTVEINLRGWTLADLDSDRHTITLDLLIQPGQYLVLARNGDPTLNGGLTVAYLYQGLALANSADELLLLAPDGSEINRVIWGEALSPTVKAGASAERTSVDSDAVWVISETLWPGSSGDKGTPGSGYQPGSTTPTATLQPGITPGATPGVTPTTTPGIGWPIATTPSDLLIDEVLYNGSDAEFIVLYNPATTPLDLTGWLIGDAEAPGDGEGIYALPAGTWLAGGERLVLARNGLVFRNQWGQPAHAEFGDNDPDTPDLARRRDLATGELALNDNGDEVLLFNPASTVADAVAFEKAAYTLLKVSGVLEAPKGYALQRVPDGRFPIVSDLRQRFLYASADPFASLALPALLSNAAPALAGELQGVWGTLGAYSIFSPSGAVPPHYLLAAAAAQGLHFVAIADPSYTEPWQSPTSMIALPAWRWTGPEKAGAIIYDTQPQPLADSSALLTYLNATGSLAQWQQGDLPTHPGIIAINADSVSAPGSLAALYKQWAKSSAPLLAVGNTNPALPGSMEPAPRYTGLAVASIDRAGIQAALAARRGWLTNRPGFWLTLHTERADNDRVWMGSSLAAGNQLTFHVDYGDNSNEAAGVAIWQDDKPIAQLATPLGNGRWSVTLPALPNSFLYAVATQADGDFAVTAPLYIQPATAVAAVILNEVLPAPGADHNGDGSIDSDDEFVELYNPSAEPLSLVGWQLRDVSSDATGDTGTGRPFTFGSGRFIGGGALLLLRRVDTRINLNTKDDYIRLLNPDGVEVDRIGWAQSPQKGLSLSRLPDGGEWEEGVATPGQSNTSAPENQKIVEEKEAEENDKQQADAEPPPVRLAPTYGQAGGPPASIAQSKLAGLEQWVEFRAVVTAPPGLFNATVYVADPAPDYTTGPLAGIGIHVYLRKGEFPPLAEGDRVLVRGLLRSFRGEMELQLDTPAQIQPLAAGTVLQPLLLTLQEIGESVEGRLVTFSGSVSGWQGDSIFLSDPAHPGGDAVRVTIRGSLPWKRPYVKKGQRWQVTGIVSQFARESPWNGGYRVLVRYQGDLVKLGD